MSRLVSICFDDAIAHQAHLVRELGIPVTFSIPTRLVGTSHRQMTWADVVRLRDEGHEIAYHSHDHSAWKQEGFDVDRDLDTAMGLFRQHGIEVKSIVPPRNEWIESEAIRSTFDWGRKGDGPLLPDKMRMKACGLSRLPMDRLSYATEFNKPRRWTIYVAHLYNPDGILIENASRDEWQVVRATVDALKASSAKFCTLSEVGREFTRELDAVYRQCPICGSHQFGPYANRPTAKCSGCNSLERHRSLTFIIDEDIVPVSGPALVVSSSEIAPALRKKGLDVTLVSKFRPAPHNNVHDLSAFESGSIGCIALQYVIPFLDNPQQALVEMARVLRDDGRILAQHPVTKSRTASVPRPDGYGVHMSERDWLAMVSKAGLKVDMTCTIMPSDDLYILARI